MPIKTLIASALLAAAITACFIAPKAAYRGPRALSAMAIPAQLKYWQSRDAAALLNTKDRRYAFIGSVFMREYRSDLGENLLLLVLEAVNFHHPRGCFDSSGFVVHFLPPLEIQTASGRRWQAQRYFMEKGRESVLVVYWITIDWKVVNWAQQRWGQLAYTLFNKKAPGFMVRIDIPTQNDRLDTAAETAVTFIRDLELELPKPDSERIFGRPERARTS